MYKRVLPFVLIFTFLISSFATAAANINAPPQNIDEALEMANEELMPICGLNNYFTRKNLDNKNINEDLWKNRSLFVYGEPHDYDSQNGHNRYLGWTKMGEKYTNVLFRHDAWDGGKINERNWIPVPWDNEKVINFLDANGEPRIRDNKFNNRPEYRSSIVRGIQEYLLSGDAPIPFDPDDGMEWEKYVHVLQPPTKFIWGMGRMWHQKPDGSIWYLTIPMAPTNEPAIPDFSVEFDKYIYENMEPGTVIEGKVKFKLNKEYQQPETAKLTLLHKVGNSEWPVKLIPLNPNDNLPQNKVIELQPGEIKEYQFKVTVQDFDTTIIAKINPVSVSIDKKWSNNSAEADIFTNRILPPTNPLLNFQAESQGGNNAQGKYIAPKKRARNTARWGDIVTANFSAPGPPPPPRSCYSLIKWELRSATIRYPKVHPDFTFGSPVEPVGTVSKQMTVNKNDNTAVINFYQDWSINGAQVYDVIKEQMVPGPTNYNISVDYVIDWHYRVGSRACCGEEDCHPCCVNWRTVRTTRSGTTTAKLLVDGTGINPLAH